MAKSFFRSMTDISDASTWRKSNFRLAEKIQFEGPMRESWGPFLLTQFMQLLTSFFAMWGAVMLFVVFPFALSFPLTRILEPSSMLLVMLVPHMIMMAFGIFAVNARH